MFKITSWTNDIVLNDKSEGIKINDKIVSATSARHGFGYSIFNHNTYDYSFETTHFVALKDTVKFYKIEFKNKRNESANYKITYYINPTFGPNEEKSSRYLLSDYYESMNSVLIRNVYNTNFNHITCFMSSTEQVINYMIEKILFKSITIDINLGPNEEKEFCFMLGTEIGNAKVSELISKYNTNEKIEEELQKVKEFWNEKLNIITVKSPDKSLNNVLNGWYLYQTIASRVYSKAGFYQV
jgi:cyclic beta-1,2-glucan synthetase